jgi:dipeptidase
MRELLNLTYRRMVSRGGYGMVAQLRSWLPDPIGGVYWYYVDNQYVSTYLPIYAGASKISAPLKEYDPEAYSETSWRWAVDMVDNLLYLRWQEAMEDVRAERDPLEASFFATQEEIEKQALEIYQRSPEEAEAFLTDHARECMDKVVELYRKLRDQLITKYTNNHEWL